MLYKMQLKNTVLCISSPKHLVDVYKVGKRYRYKYLYDKCIIDDNNYIEFEWLVYCAEYNHYQFTTEEFNLYFVDVVKHRELLITNILE